MPSVRSLRGRGGNFLQRFDDLSSRKKVLKVNVKNVKCNSKPKPPTYTSLPTKFEYKQILNPAQAVLAVTRSEVTHIWCGGWCMPMWRSPLKLRRRAHPGAPSSGDRLKLVDKFEEKLDYPRVLIWWMEQVDGYCTKADKVGVPVQEQLEMIRLWKFDKKVLLHLNNKWQRWSAVPWNQGGLSSGKDLVRPNYTAPQVMTRGRNRWRNRFLVHCRNIK
ncbi:hypothetical protein BDK51DRAFT_30254 [Blyttiomyces helicus]|uniref:Uncharacterized protein n=1 Tax=Blyttiomyces helicus TaxID=388810 RepID=A0A4P9W3L4_9FUNG|nr:hypothetical protein BDK51DRAFT_30254 [Blyttiomyces helicus]|eukprot:RKO85843.1 hypothetical protein BDK51DRAFT_30254 [Blyttiomyces helicus]